MGFGTQGKEKRIAYILRSMPDLRDNPDAYPQPLRVMWDLEDAITESFRLNMVARSQGESTTFSVIDCPADDDA